MLCLKSNTRNRVLGVQGSSAYTSLIWDAAIYQEAQIQNHTVEELLPKQ